MRNTSLKFDHYYKFTADPNNIETLVLERITKPYKNLEKALEKVQRLKMTELKPTFIHVALDGKTLKMKLIRQQMATTYSVTTVARDAILILVSSNWETVELFVLEKRAGLSFIIKSRYELDKLRHEILKMRRQAKIVGE
jgi:hypothetical protein